MRNRLIALPLAGAAALLGMTPITASATAAAPPPVPASAAAPRPVPAKAGNSMKTWTEKPVRVKPGSRSGADCPDLARVTGCSHIKIRTELYRNGVTVGRLYATATSSYFLSVKRRDFINKMNVKVTKVTGLGVIIVENYTPLCFGTCSSTGSLTTTAATADTTETFVFHDDTTAEHTFHAQYLNVATAPGFGTKEVRWEDPFNFRCDDLLRNEDGVGQKAGCVITDFIPTLTDMQQLPKISKSIRKIQSRGVHAGRPGSGYPLHRLRDDYRATRNRHLVCPRKPPPGKEGLTCDEYPFAHSYEGGMELGKKSRGIAWVPPAENLSQGGLINKFNLFNRILDNDPFWVKV